MKKYSLSIKIRKIVVCMISVLLISNITVLTGCSKKQSESENNKVTVNKNIDKENDTTEKENSKEENETEKSNEDTTTDSSKGTDDKKTKEQEDKIKFVKHELSKDSKASFNTQWEKSIDSKLSACIEGKGPDGIEEGIGKVYVKNSSSQENWYLELAASGKQISPKVDLEWIDNENIAVIVGLGYGTVSMGGNLYKINVNTGKTEVLYDTKSEKKQVISLKKVHNKLELNILVYDDDNFNKNHTEKKTINL